MSSGVNYNQIIRLAKRFLLPQVKKWWKQRQAKKHSQQQPHQQQPHQQQQQQQQQQQSYAQASHQQQQYHGQQQQPQQFQQYQQYPQQQQGYGPPQQGGYYPQQQQQPYAGGYSQSPPPQQQYRPPGGFNDDQANARDPHYISLRNAALQEGSLMHSAFDRASRAHDAGDGAAAKQLSNEGHMHQRKKGELNDQAADWIFGANNRDKGPGEVDLHGLYVQEAIERAERAVQTAQSQNLPTLRLITGKGIHSNQGIAKIKPAIESLMVKYSLSAELDPHNSGVLVVDLTGRGAAAQGRSRDLGWVDQQNRESGEGECVIM